MVEARRAEGAVGRFVHDQLIRPWLEASNNTRPGIGPRRNGRVAHRRSVAGVALPEDRHQVATVRQVRRHRGENHAETVSPEKVEQPPERRLDHATASLVKVAQHARDGGLAGPRERRGGIEEILLHVDDHECSGARIERQRGRVAMALKGRVSLVRSACHRRLLGLEPGARPRTRARFSWLASSLRYSALQGTRSTWAGARYECRASATSNLQGTPAWPRRPRRPGR